MTKASWGTLSTLRLAMRTVIPLRRSHPEVHMIGVCIYVRLLRVRRNS